MFIFSSSFSSQQQQQVDTYAVEEKLLHVNYLLVTMEVIGKVLHLNNLLIVHLTLQSTGKLEC